MFALKIVDSDAFIDMPDSAQNLYFHLAMRADDDGFISNPRKVMRMINASDDNLKILLAKRFLLSFDTGIVVIKHWRLHNYIAKDRYTETIYKEEKEKLFVKANGAYTDHPEPVAIPYTGCIQDDDTGKVSEGKDRLDKDSKEETPDKPAIPEKPKRSNNTFIPPTHDEIEKYVIEKQLCIDPSKFIDWYSKTDWKDNQGKQVKNWKNKLINWDSREKEKNPGARPYSKPTPFVAKVCPSCGASLSGLFCKTCMIQYDENLKELF